MTLAYRPFHRLEGQSRENILYFACILNCDNAIIRLRQIVHLIDSVDRAYLLSVKVNGT